MERWISHFILFYFMGVTGYISGSSDIGHTLSRGLRNTSVCNRFRMPSTVWSRIIESFGLREIPSLFP
jgi:hypothetical protein